MNEQDKGRHDAIVSATYRELADERTPENLDRRILDMAAGASAAPRRGGLWSAWMKPVAWAATVGLTVAIVVEMNQVETPLPADLSLQEAEKTEVRSEYLPKPSTEAVPPQSPATEQRSGEEHADDAALLGKSEPAAPQRERLNDSVSPDELKRQHSNTAPAGRSARETAETAPRSKAMLLHDAAPDSAMLERQDPVVCSEETRRGAEPWRQCIAALRDAGMDAAADREQALYVDKFGPISSAPDLNK